MANAVSGSGVEVKLPARTLVRMEAWSHNLDLPQRTVVRFEDGRQHQYDTQGLPALPERGRIHTRIHGRLKEARLYGLGTHKTGLVDETVEIFVYHAPKRSGRPSASSVAGVAGVRTGYQLKKAPFLETRLVGWRRGGNSKLGPPETTVRLSWNLRKDEWDKFKPGAPAPKRKARSKRKARTRAKRP